MREPFLTEFRGLLQTGAGLKDIHDSSEATETVAQETAVNKHFLRRELERVQTHQRNICPVLEEEVGRVRNILDVGCSTGGTTVALALSKALGAAEVIGVDPNELSLRAARVRARGHDVADGRIQFLHISPTDPLPFADGQFDLVVCVSVLEFLLTPKAREGFAADLERVTQPGGYIYLSTPTPFRPREMHSQRWFGDWRRNDGYPWASTRRSILRMFSHCKSIPLSRQYRRMARARLGSVVDRLPDQLVCPLIRHGTFWQKFLLQKHR